MRPPVRKALLYALRCRCPYCHQGGLFRGRLNKMFPRCPNCGLSYFRESGFYVGGMIATYILTTFTVIAVFLVSLLLPRIDLIPENTRLAFWMVFAILLAFVYVRPAYSLWLAINFWIDPWTPEQTN